jgi:hypothetical protein
MKRKRNRDPLSPTAHEVRWQKENNIPDFMFEGLNKNKRNIITTLEKRNRCSTASLNSRKNVIEEHKIDFDTGKLNLQT